MGQCGSGPCGNTAGGGKVADARAKAASAGGTVGLHATGGFSFFVAGLFFFLDSNHGAIS